MTVELALEIPVALLRDIYPLTDLGFSLAHMILKNKKYRDFYRGELQIMDNGMYELGDPLEAGELTRAAESVMPTAIIAPDWMDEASRTSQASILMRNFFRGVTYTSVGVDGKPAQAIKPSIGVVVQGKDLFQRRDFFNWCVDNEFRPICFPFRTRKQRYTLIGSLASENRFTPDGWYHLLGLNNRDELTQIKELPGRWSVDTAKPCKPGLDMSQDWTKWTGRGRLDHMRGYTAAEVELVKANIAHLRAFL